MERRYCKYCGKPIPVEGLSEWRYRAKVYCSGACRNRSFSESRMSPRITKECPVCHTKFETLSCRDKVYCSTRCGYIGAAWKKRNSAGITRVLTAVSAGRKSSAPRKSITRSVLSRFIWTARSFSRTLFSASPRN